MFPNNSKVCRICLLGSSKGIISLFTVCNGLFKIYNKIMEVTDIEIHEEDDLPKWICYSCLVHLETSYQFKLQAEKSDKLLKQQIALEQNGMLQEYTSEDIQLRRQCIEDNKNELKITNVISQASRTDSRSFTPQGAINIGGLCRCKGGTGPLCDACTMITTSTLTQQELVTVVNNTSLLPVCTCGGDDNLKCAVCMASMVKTSMDNILVKIGGQTEFINVALATENDAALEPEFIDVNVPDDIIMCTCSSESDVKCEACLKLADISNENMTVEEITVSHSDTEFIDVEESSSKDKVTYPEPEFVDVNAPCDVSVCTCSPDSSVKCDACLKMSDEGSVLPTLDVSESKDNVELQTAMQQVLSDSATANQSDLNLECFMCNEVFPTKHKFDVHLSSHSGLACLECCKSFANKRGLRLHNRLHLDSKLETKSELECHICDKVFENKEIVADHILSHTEVKIFKCYYCDFLCHSYKNIDKHRLTHKIEPFTCEICCKVFDSQSDIDAHTPTHMVNGVYKCHFCDKTFSREMQLRSHLYLHLCRREYKCKFCDKRFIFVKRLIKHEETHKGSMRCDVCNKEFKTNSGLMSHKETHHTGVDFKCVCEICGRGFMSKALLKSHKIIHYGQPTNCDICKKQFPHARALRVHKNKIHTVHKSYECKQCDKIFKHSESLNVHVKSAHFNTRYFCKICQAMFAQSSALKTHVNIIHHGLEPHKCEKCGLTFKWKQTCDKHKLKCEKK